MSTYETRPSNGWLILLAVLIALLYLGFSGCAIASEATKKAKAIKKIEKLEARQRQLAEKYGIGHRDTVYYTDTIVTGGARVDTFFWWTIDHDTVYSPPTEVIKWKIIREKGDSILVPYRVQIECPTDTVRINVALPCPELKTTKWERFWSNAYLTLRRWWWIALALAVLYLAGKNFKRIKGLFV